MKIKLIEKPEVCSDCTPPMTGFALQGRQSDSGEIPCYLGTAAKKRTDEQMRLQRSWEAVLTEIGPREVEACRW
jgi:hypothetical protein